MPSKNLPTGVLRPERFGLSIVLAFLFLTLSPQLVESHGGGLDSFGCHHNRKLGGYHCHRGPMAGQAFFSKSEMIQALEGSKGGRGKRKTFDPSSCLGQGDRCNCSDFESQVQAQAILRSDPTDPNRLDRDRDGLACESNPGPFDRRPVPRF